MLHLETTEEDRRRWIVTSNTTTHHPSVPEMMHYARERWQYISRTPGVVSRCTVRDDSGNVVARWEWRRSGM